MIDLTILDLDPDARLVITGGPASGKTTAAKGLNHGELQYTDDLKDEMEWEEVSEYVAREWLTQPGPWTVEGVAAVRALRKYPKLGLEGPPCDVVVYLLGAWQPLTDGQARMEKGCLTVWNETVGGLRERGVEVRVLELGEELGG